MHVHVLYPVHLPQFYGTSNGSPPPQTTPTAFLLSPTGFLWPLGSFFWDVAQRCLLWSSASPTAGRRARPGAGRKGLFELTRWEKQVPGMQLDSIMLVRPSCPDNNSGCRRAHFDSAVDPLSSALDAVQQKHLLWGRRHSAIRMVTIRCPCLISGPSHLMTHPEGGAVT
jgi:hypothetical protein